MKRYIDNIGIFAAIFFLFTACEEKAELTVLEEVNFAAVPEASVSSLTLTGEQAAETVLTLSWPAVTYPVLVPVTYTVQLATPADTSGNWDNAFQKEVGADVLSASFTGLELNEIALGLGMEPNAEGTLVLRVKSYLDRDAFSQPLEIKITPYQEVVVNPDFPALWVAGDFQGWDVTTAPTIVSKNDDKIYEGYIYIPEGGTNEFKLYAQPDWAPTSYGTEEEGVVIEANFAGANFVAPSAGYYFLAVDLNAMTYLLIKTDWGIIGGATPGGWDADMELTYDPETQVWRVTADMKADGTFKFRANKEWQLDFGIDENGDLAYANHPWLAYIEQPQLTVPEDGNYTIMLDLHVPGYYTYGITKN